MGKYASFEKMPYGVAVICVERENIESASIVYVNKKMAEMYKTSTESMIDTKCFLWLENPNWDWKSIFHQVAYEENNFQASGYSQILELYIQVDCYALENGYCVCMVQDKSETFQRKRMLEALDSPYCMIGVCNLEQNTWMIKNKRCKVDGELNAKLNHSQYWKEIIGKHALKKYQKGILQMLDPDFVCKNLSKEQRSLTYDFEKQLVEGGEITWSRMSIIWMGDNEKGKINEFIISLQNIQNEVNYKNKQKQVITESYNVAKQANNLRAEFLSNVTCNLRSPLNNIIGMLEIAQKYATDPERVRAYLERAGESAAELKKMISEILNVSQIKAVGANLQKEEINILNLLKSVRMKVDAQIKEKKQKFDIAFENKGHMDVCSDRVRLEQIMLNLLQNAIAFTPKGGTISLRISEIEELGEGFGLYKILIQDNGVGIEQDLMERIYEPFEIGTRGIDGEESRGGLGMPIVKRLVEVMNGEISMLSEVGKGTTAEILLPLKIVEKLTYAKVKPFIQNKAGGEQDFFRIGAMNFCGKKALIVDDNKGFREILRDILEITGIEVWEAENGEVAMDYFEGHAQDISIIFMDLQMPILNGYEATKSIRRRSSYCAGKVPVVAMSKSEQIEEIRYSNISGMNEYLLKPLDLRQLGIILARWLM